jgi:hypothetical protein
VLGPLAAGEKVTAEKFNQLLDLTCPQLSFT